VPTRLRTVAASRYVTPFREGGSLPALLEVDDAGLYVGKFRGAGQGPLALVAEVIAGELARALGLPMPELVMIELDAAIGRGEPDPEIQELLLGSVGENLGVEFLAGAETYSPSQDDPRRHPQPDRSRRRPLPPTRRPQAGRARRAAVPADRRTHPAAGRRPDRRGGRTAAREGDAGAAAGAGRPGAARVVRGRPARGLLRLPDLAHRRRHPPLPGAPLPRCSGRARRAAAAGDRPDFSAPQIKAWLDALGVTAEGRELDGPLAGLSQSERFGLLTAPSSTVIQASPIHTASPNRPSGSCSTSSSASSLASRSCGSPS
jgi:Protein of unknown function (DUF3037)